MSLHPHLVITRKLRLSVFPFLHKNSIFFALLSIAVQAVHTFLFMLLLLLFNGTLVHFPKQKVASTLFDSQLCIPRVILVFLSWHLFDVHGVEKYWKLLAFLIFFEMTPAVLPFWLDGRLNVVVVIETIMNAKIKTILYAFFSPSRKIKNENYFLIIANDRMMKCVEWYGHINIKK